MKILLIFTFFLISGPVSCNNVIGYSGGSVIIYCTNGTNSINKGYFCKITPRQCVNQNPDKTPNTLDHKDRVSVAEARGELKVTFRNLSSEDGGAYECGETGKWSYIVTLEVKTDPCCSEPKTVIGSLGETITINCSYPEEFKHKAKFFYIDDENEFIPVIGTSDHQRDTSSLSETLRKRFSISDNKESRVISVRIRDVREDDGGDYYCGATDDQSAVKYETLFTKIHLQVKGSTSRPTPTDTTTAPGSSDTIVISIVVALLLIGGAALVCFIVILKKRRGSAPSHTTQHSGSKQVSEEVKPVNTSADASSPANNSDKVIYSTVRPHEDREPTYSNPAPPQDQELTYSTVDFNKNPGSPTDASASVSKEEPDTEYSTIKLPTVLE